MFVSNRRRQKTSPIKTLIEEAGYTQSDIARIIDMRINNFNSFVHGHISLPWRCVEKFCSTLKIDEDAFVNGKIIKLKK